MKKEHLRTSTLFAYLLALFSYLLIGTAVYVLTGLHTMLMGCPRITTECHIKGAQLAKFIQSLVVMPSYITIACMITLITIIIWKHLGLRIAAFLGCLMTWVSVYILAGIYAMQQGRPRIHTGNCYIGEVVTTAKHTQSIAALLFYITLICVFLYTPTTALFFLFAN